MLIQTFHKYKDLFILNLYLIKNEKYGSHYIIYKKKPITRNAQLKNNYFINHVINHM